MHSLYIFFAVQYGQRSFDVVILVKKISIGQVQILKYGFSRICPLEIILNLHVYTLKSIDILSSIQIFLSRFMWMMKTINWKKNNWKEYAAWFAHLKALNKKFSDQSYHYKVLLRQKSLQGRLWSSQLGYIIVHRYNMALSEQLCILKISSTVRVSWMLVWFSRLGSFVVFNPKARQASTVSGIHPSTICHQLMRTFRISDSPQKWGLFSNVLSCTCR